MVPVCKYLLVSSYHWIRDVASPVSLVKRRLIRPRLLLACRRDVNIQLWLFGFRGTLRWAWAQVETCCSGCEDRFDTGDWAGAREQLRLSLMYYSLGMDSSPRRTERSAQLFFLAQL